MSENEKEELNCKFPADTYGTLHIGDKTYVVGLTDVKRTVENGRIRHKFILTEVI